MKPKIAYVLSAVSQGLFPNNKKLEEIHNEAIKDGLKKLVDIVKTDLNEKCTHYIPDLSFLFNAYTEDHDLDMFKYFDNMNMDSIYADSGGLQIVTAGREKTDVIKNQIYSIQTYADFAMCFDEIPLSRKSTAERTRNERSNVGNKIFHRDKLKESGHQTGLNIKQQIEVFRKLKAKTKVVPIVQGNSADDMVVFFKEIAKVLKDDDWNHISGLAVADTCIGNGELESIEMLRAAHKIAQFAHPNVSNHLHILGVGSIKRMRPIIFLMRSKYLDNFKYISYDSSSHTSTFTYGLLKVDGTCKTLGAFRNHKVEKHFVDVYNLFHDYFREIGMTQKEFIDIILGQRETVEHGKQRATWNHAAIKERVLQTDSDNHIIVGHLAKAFHTLFQVHNFILNIDKLWNERYSLQPIPRLLRVKNDADMNKWIDDMRHTVPSKRIAADEKKNSLKELWV